MFEKPFKSLNLDEAKADLRTQGFHQVPIRLDKVALTAAIAQMDEICTNNEELEVNYGGSEHRIWHAHKHIAAAESFRRFSDAIVPKLADGINPAKNILAIRNKPLSDGKNELRKGRWHLDSFRDQYKIFVFLQDVGPNDGPFELVPQTQKSSVKFKHAIQGRYFRTKDLILRTGKRGYQHVSDSFVEHVERNYPSQLFTVPAGTILIANTSALHRAHPVNGGERYAFTSYH